MRTIPLSVVLLAGLVGCALPSQGGAGLTGPTPAPPPGGGASTTVSTAATFPTQIPQDDLCGADPACTNLWELPHHWTVTGTFGTNPGGDITLGDLDGDGQVDALVNLADETGLRHLIVSGPLDRDLHLPDDASGELTGAAWVYIAGDVTGDGQCDVVYGPEDADTSDVLAGPFSGVVDLSPVAPAVTGLPAYSTFLDLDGYGDAEAIAYVHQDDGSGGTRFEVYDAPIHTGDPPALTVNPTCDDASEAGYGWEAIDYRAHLAPSDVDGDGVRDLMFVTLWGAGAGCPSMLVSGAARGVVSESSPGVILEREAVAVGDANGDGIPESFVPGSTGDESADRVVVGPLSAASADVGLGVVPPFSARSWPLASGHVLSAGAGTPTTLYAGPVDATVIATWPVPPGAALSEYPYYFPQEAPGLVFFVDPAWGVAIATAL